MAGLADAAYNKSALAIQDQSNGLGKIGSCRKSIGSAANSIGLM